MLRIFTLCLALAGLPCSVTAQALQLNVVQETIELNPADIVGAEPFVRDGQWAILIRLAPGAGAMFGAVTGRSIGKQMQIVVDNRIISAPVVREAITQGEVMIGGNMSEADARELAAKIKR